MKISLKIKLLLALVSVPLCLLFIFSYLAQSTFYNDKLAYVYSTSDLQAKSIRENISSFASFWKLFQENTINQHVWGKSQFSEEALSLMSRKTDLVAQLAFMRKDNKSVVTYFNDLISDDQRLTLIKKFRQESNKLIKSNQTLVLSLENLDENTIFISHSFRVESSDSEIIVTSLVKSPEIVKIFYDEDLFDVYLLDKKLQSTFKPLVNDLKSSLVQSSFREYMAKNLNSGALKVLGKENYIGSFSALTSGQYVLLLTKESVVMMALEKLKQQTLYFLIIAAAFALILGVVFSHKLTKSIRILFEATKLIAAGEYPERLDVNTKDEVEVLADSFLTMSSKIRNLLTELRKYNEHLEELVAQRTAELSNAMRIQKSILESLGQAFLVVDEAGKIKPIYSNAVLKMFTTNPVGENFWKIISKTDSDQNDCLQLFKSAFDGMLPLKDIKEYAPSFYINQSKQFIDLDYHPFINEENKLNGVIIVGTDKTREIEAEKALQNEKAFLEMIQKILLEKDHFYRFLYDFKNTLSRAHEIVDKKIGNSKDELVRILHTLKGNASMYSLIQIKESIHQLELKIKQTDVNESFPWDMIRIELRNLFNSLKTLLEKDLHFLNISFNTDDEKVEMSSLMVKSFYQKWANELPENLRKDFYRNFLCVRASSLVSPYKIYALELAKRLDKKLGVFEILNQDFLVERNSYDDFSQSIVHLIRNTIDHGLESPEERLLQQKMPEGEIIISFNESSLHWSMTFSDDGRGLNIEKILGPQLTYSEEALVQKLFYEGISTKDVVSDVSGQGAGMSAIGLCVKKHQGKIFIDLNRKTGVLFRFEFPKNQATS